MADRPIKAAAWFTAIALVAWAPAAAAAELNPKGVGIFQDYIQPLFKKHCFKCHSHGAGKIKGGLVLDTPGGLRAGGASGEVIKPGQPDASLMLKAVSYADPKLKMPPKQKLGEEDLKHLRLWVQLGAPDPRKTSENAGLAAKGPASAENLWSLRPVRQPDAPGVKDRSWPRQRVDRFVLARLEARALAPAPDAEASRFLRRLTFDLIGLPPQPAEIESFMAAIRVDREKAIAAAVDRLLDSPRFGERWGRHWLDVARYAESNGKAWNMTLPYAWRYRDYVIDAFNKDKPFDRFVQEQVAGDLLPAPDAAARNEHQVATGFLALGSKNLYEKEHEIPREQPEWVDDQLQTLGKAVLGLTIGCARCHDHKFDPIPQADYYAMAGIFMSTDILSGPKLGKPPYWRQKRLFDLHAVPLGDPGQIALARAQAPEASKIAAELNEAKKKLKSLGKKKKPDPAEAKKLRARIDKLEASIAHLAKTMPRFEYAFGVRDAEKIGPTPIRIRGVWDKHGEVVERGVLSAVSGASMPVIPADRSGRLELARWVTDPANPLTARVYVNRVWGHLFGRGIVETTDNFGATAADPTHPLLLDDLAHRFVHEFGWSTKELIRHIVRSRVYRMAAAHCAEAYATDPENRLLWRYPSRRIEAEALRDAVLAIGGTLDLEQPGPSGVQKLGYTMLDPNMAKKIRSGPQRKHRSVYMAIFRGQPTDGLLDAFDLPDPGIVVGRRDVSNVPTQSLHMMNNPLILDSAASLAKRLNANESTHADRVALAYRTILSRSPEPRESRRAREFLGASPEENQWALFCQALLMSAEFRYLN